MLSLEPAVPKSFKLKVVMSPVQWGSQVLGCFIILLTRFLSFSVPDLSLSSSTPQVIQVYVSFKLKVSTQMHTYDAKKCKNAYVYRKCT